MQKQLNEIILRAKENIEVADSLTKLEELRVSFLGKKGEITAILKGMSSLSKEDKKELGQLANKAREEVATLLEETITKVKEKEESLAFVKEKIDVTEPGKRRKLGSKHPITVTIDEINKILMSMGFAVAEGPQVETVFNVFDALNSPPNHPSRSLTDTFYISDDVVLRTHTSSVQIRTLLSENPPIKIIAPGRCFRCDTPDATHSPMFHQVEGLLVDKGVTMADLKGTLDTLAKKLFGEATRTNFRPHHFPFTEPSAEMDVSCFKCNGEGCRICKGSGWIEILGCGMVHPNVLGVGGIDTEEFSGFAFGMGVERIAMLKYGVEDIRLFYENDMRFIEQFK